MAKKLDKILHHQRKTPLFIQLTLEHNSAFCSACFCPDGVLFWHTDMGGAAIAPPSSLVEKDCK